MSATLLLTRPEAQSRAFLESCEMALGRPIPAVISPLMRIEPVGDLPDLDGYGTLAFTSANGVRRVGAALAGHNVITVGEATAVLARSFGADARAYGENVEAFLERASNIAVPVLYCRGVHVQGDLAAALQRQGARVDEAVIYDQVARPLSAAGLAVLSRDSKVVAPVFSARTATLLSSQSITADLTVIAMSKKVATAWVGDEAIRIATAPTAEAMQAAVLEAM